MRQTRWRRRLDWQAGADAPGALRRTYGGALVLAAIGAAMLAGCGGDPLDCGEGTKLAGGACVLLDAGPRCGTGTAAADGVCVAPKADVSGLEADIASADVSTGTSDAGADSAGNDAAIADGTNMNDTTGDGHAMAGDVTATDDGGAGDATPDAAATDAPPPCEPTCHPVGGCGPDGCGGSCGSCGKGAPYCLAGQCAKTCAASCDGKQCGDDGCGGSCGKCSGAAACSITGKCVPKGWTCAATTFNDGVYCDCNCGAFDSDCMVTDRPVKNCAKAGATCDQSGSCVGGTVGKWTCAAAAYDDKFTCNCGCGLPDPDCKDAAKPIVSADPTKPCATCSSAGICATCTPNCVDGNGVKLVCGADGCGGLCGECPASKLFCAAGICQKACTKTCTAKDCGDDGCGGSCGSCGVGLACDTGVCKPIPTALSCKGNCGKTAAGGCACSATCAATGTCCVDAALHCPMACAAACAGKACGGDGCGGSCGTCKSGVCNAGVCGT